MSATSLETALRGAGISCTVEAMDRLAIIIPGGDLPAVEEAHVRREALRLIREHGFTHGGLELVADPMNSAAFHRDQD